MNALSYVAGAVQIGGVMAGAPLVVGLTRQVRARWEGRAGAGILQPCRDIAKQLGKQQITPRGRRWCSRPHPRSSPEPRC